MKEALFYSKIDETTVRCELCPHNCCIKDGKSGICRVRFNEKGRLFSEIYEKLTAVNIDPIEKKPLYHFKPNSSILSIGTFSCNMKCFYCQNHHISQQKAHYQLYSVDNIIQFLKENDELIGVAYTYNEPIIWYEYVLELSEQVRKISKKNVMVTNGFINKEPLIKLLPYIDGLNIDLKGFSDEFYKNNCSARLEEVKETIEISYEMGKHIEITNLVIPTLNDNLEEIEKMVEFISKISPHIPLHFSVYHPEYKCRIKSTPFSTMEKIYDLAKVKLHNVFIGNLVNQKMASTFCFNCGKLLISREGYRTVSYMNGDSCPHCGEKIYGIF